MPPYRPARFAVLASGLAVAPAVAAPAVEAPAVEAPAVEAPAVEAPAVEAPAVEALPSPVKVEPSISSTVPGDRLESRRSVTLLISAATARAAGRSAADAYATTDFV